MSKAFSFFLKSKPPWGAKAVKTRGVLNGESENEGGIGQDREVDSVERWADRLKRRVRERKVKSPSIGLYMGF